MIRTAARPARTAVTFTLALALAGGLSGCGGGAPAPTELPSAPHPLVIVAIDGLRADRVGALGASVGKTPNLDALARESVAFTWAFAQAPQGAPSLATVLTGVYPSTHGVRQPGEALADEALALGEILAAGRETAAFVEGEGVTADLGFAQGFTVFEARPGSGIRDVGARAIAWMKDRAQKNFLLLIESGEPARAGASYDGALAAVDGFVGELLGALRQLDLDDRATLVVFGTNGLDLGEHPADGGPSLHATLTRVPLFVRFPGGVRAQVTEEYVELADLGPTLLAANGAAPRGNAHGKSLLPLVRGEGKPPYIAFGESPRRGGERFVAMAGYQLIRTTEGDRSELYRLSTDPLGLADVSATEAQRVAVLSDHLAAWEKLVAVSSLDPDKQAAPLDDATLEKLKSLGYVQ